MEDSRSFSTLISDLVNQISTLFRKEIQLARAEVSEKVDQVLAGVGGMIAGAVFLIGALLVLLQAAVAALVEFADLSTTVASLIVAAVVGIIGFILVRSGMNKLKASSLAPRRTVEQLSRDATVAKEQVR